MIEVRSILNEQDEEIIELRFPKGTSEKVWLRACTAYEGFHRMEFKRFEDITR
jgi:hypothetical protein